MSIYNTNWRAVKVPVQPSMVTLTMTEEKFNSMPAAMQEYLRYHSSRALRVGGMCGTNVEFDIDAHAQNELLRMAQEIGR